MRLPTPLRVPAALRALVRKEVFHILRDRRTLLVVLAMPVVQMVLFGYALQTDLEEIRLVVVDPSPDVRTRSVVERFRAVPEYRIVGTSGTAAAVDALMERSRADQALVFGAGFAGDLASPRGAPVLVVTDGASPVTGPSMESFAVGILGGWAREKARSSGGLEAGRSAAPPAPPVETATHFAFNPTLESQLLFVPGLLAFILTMVSALMTAITVAREKETGTLELLLVSPLRPRHIVSGKVVPYLGLAFVNALTTLALAYWLFGVPVRGSLALLLVECILYVAVCVALGVLISTRTPTQRTAMLGTVLGTMLPTAVLSGMIFPIESMPGWLRPVTLVVPARWFIEVVRGVMLKGASMATLWPETLVLAGMTVLLLAASVLSFRAQTA